MEKQEVVQFNENHKWCGCFGFVNEVKKCKDENGKEFDRIMVGVPIPTKGTAYIFCRREDIDHIGETDLVLVEGSDDEETEESTSEK